MEQLLSRAEDLERSEQLLFDSKTVHVHSRPAESALPAETGWPLLHPMTAAGTTTRTTLLNRWYPALAVLSCIMLCRSAWPNIRTGEPVRSTSRLSKTAWWIFKTLGKNSWGSSSNSPLNLHPVDLTKDMTNSGIGAKTGLNSLNYNENKASQSLDLDCVWYKFHLNFLNFSCYFVYSHSYIYIYII